MNTLYEAMNKTAATDNGCLAHHNSLSANLDFFYLAGASRGKDVKKEFRAALIENSEVALRNLQWLRDIRGGAGERQLFRELLLVALEVLGETKDLVNLIGKVPELGRFDDLIWINENSTKLQDFACHVLIQALRENNGLAFKWTPIKGETAKKLRKALGFKKEADWRKFVVAGRKTVEQQMCAKEWNDINFSTVPSVASARYQKAFGRNATEKYTAYLKALVKGEKGVKINASAVYPYDIYKSCFQGNPEIAEQQWKALPNYMEGSTERVLPLIDVSGSMSCPAGGNNSLSCMDVAISLGWYVANKSTGIFKNVFLSFESEPRMFKLDENNTLLNDFKNIKASPWGGSTNIQKAFGTMLQAAVENKVPSEQMPTTLLVFSDMQFDCGHIEGTSVTAFDSIKQQYQQSGYQMPKLVFWNLNASNKTIPVTKHETGTMLVSGFSPSLMKGILSGSSTPEGMMLDTVMVDRYKLD